LKKWLTIQLGSREHFAIPRALERNGALAVLLTDSWIPTARQSIVGRFSSSLALRHHEDIPDHKVRSETLSRLACDAAMRLRGIHGWEAIVKRNHWFQEWAARQVSRFDGSAQICFSYSYTARLPFRAAKKKGMLTVLGQIDPGPMEQEIVDAGTKNYANLRIPGEGQPPPRYWEEWREEVDLADRILVNSEWSRDLLVRQNIEKSKISIVPLMYEGSGPSATFETPETDGITVLFLGQIILRKGVGHLFDAIRLLKGRPIRFVIAGPMGIEVPSDIALNPAVEILGPVDRMKAQRLYRQADIFLLPTLSDGFAITQLEAMAYGVPVIASTACGAVVSSGIDGLLLDEVSPETIAEALIRASNPDELAFWKSNTTLSSKFSMNTLATNIQDLIR
jgi:glycosyltransferase involved in cell wall biosynthesis